MNVTINNECYLAMNLGMFKTNYVQFDLSVYNVLLTLCA